MSINNAILADKLAEKLSTSKKDAKAILETVVQTIKESVLQGEEVNVSGLGKFVTPTQAGRSGTNHLTGGTYQTEARRVVKFKPAKAFREEVAAQLKAE